MSDRYKSMVTAGAASDKIQTFLAEGGTVALTMSILSNLKEANYEYTAMNEMSCSTLYRNFLIEDLSAKEG